MLPFVLFTRPCNRGQWVTKSPLNDLVYIYNFPLMEVFWNATFVDVTPYDIIITTSPQAVIYLGTVKGATMRPLHVVGHGSYALAKSLGFQDVALWEGGSSALLRRFDGTLHTSKRLLYCRGVHIKKNITEQLKTKGYDIEEAIVYESRPIDVIPEKFRQILRQNQTPVMICFFSKRAAEFFLTQITPAALISHIAIACLSPEIAEPFQKQGWKTVKIAATFTADAMINEVMNWCQTHKIHPHPPLLKKECHDHTQGM